MLMSKFNQKLKGKEKKWWYELSNYKKMLFPVIIGKFDDDTKSKLKLSTTDIGFEQVRTADNDSIQMFKNPHLVKITSA